MQLFSGINSLIVLISLFGDFRIKSSFSMPFTLNSMTQLLKIQEMLSTLCVEQIFTYNNDNHQAVIYSMDFKRRKVMPKTMQNIVMLKEPSVRPHIFSLKGGNMCLNRFCMEEDVAFEVLGVYDLVKPIFLKPPSDCHILCQSPEKGKG